MARIARVAATNGGKTRAILKLAGRAAFALTFAAMDLASWVFGALILDRRHLCAGQEATIVVAFRRIRPVLFAPDERDRDIDIPIDLGRRLPAHGIAQQLMKAR
jgi:hypothetical protein